MKFRIQQNKIRNVWHPKNILLDIQRKQENVILNQDKLLSIKADTGMTMIMVLAYF